MVRAGETSGMLGESLDRFVALADRELRTRQRVKEATRYPKIVILSLMAASVVLIGFVIPRFAQVFNQFKTPLPLPTRIMIGINDLFQDYWFIILGIAIVTPIMIRNYLRTEKDLSEKFVLLGGLAKSLRRIFSVIPAQVGIQSF